MTNVARKLLDGVMALPTPERARVAAALIASLDEHEDDDVEGAWAAEIERRAERVLAGQSAGSPWEDVRERVEAQLKSK
jgi:putative addiction module component (TIGR02574 family)